MTLTKTGIEYGTHNWNFYHGCRHKDEGICPVPHCWAESMANRHHEDFHQPHLVPEHLLDPLAGRNQRQPHTILTCFTGDLFGDWVRYDMPTPVPLSYRVSASPDLCSVVTGVVINCPQDTFLFLTKAPQNYKKWGVFPDNCWLGATVCNPEMLSEAYVGLKSAQAKHKWLSYEPLLAQVIMESQYMVDAGIEWVVIGAQSNPTKMPDIAWVREIVEACDQAGVKVWLKNNLRPLFGKDNRAAESLSWGIKEWAVAVSPILRQERPW